MALNIGCLLMAAGNSVRFGSNKLAAEYHGRPLYSYALKAIPASEFARVAVVTQYDMILSAATSLGFTALINPEPGRGISSTILIGLEALAELDAIMFLVADQPALRRATVTAILDFYRAHPGNIVAACAGARRGNPTVFPRRFFPELSSLSGDVGGSFVIRAHPEALLTYDVGDERELLDIDTPLLLFGKEK